LLSRDRQVSNPEVQRPCHRVRNRRRGRAVSRLADTERCVPSLNQFNFEFGDFIKPEDWIFAPGSSAYTFVGNPDLLLQRPADGLDNPSLDLIDQTIPD